MATPSFVVSPNRFPRLGRFLRDASWPEPSSEIVCQRMEDALKFFQTRLGGWCDRPLDQTDKGYQRHGANPWSFKIHGKVTKLTSAMQAIDFNRDVRAQHLDAGYFLRRYGVLRDRGQPASGIWYTDRDVPANRLALRPDQTTALGFSLLVPTEVLVSTAGDMLVDWGMQAPRGVTLQVGRDYHYREGGGIQYVVPDAAKILKPL